MNKDSEQHPSPKLTEDELLEQIRSLPPRSVTHRKRKEKTKNEREMEDELITAEDEVENENDESESKGKRPFPLIQIMLYTFLAVIITFFIFWYWQEQQHRANELNVDPFDRFVKEGGLNPTGPAAQDTTEEKGGADGVQDESIASEQESTSGLKEDTTPPTEDSLDPPLTNENAMEQDTNSSNDRVEPGSTAGAEESSSGSKIIAEHIVQRGEGLYGISRTYYGTGEYVDQLAEYNRIPDKRTIYSGMKIVIPELSTLLNQ